jgi:DNA-binding transcriptional MerR regulator
MPGKTTLSIGELASRAGVTRDTLRYYEKLGLMAQAPRTTGGFRVYSAAVLQRLQFIKQAQRHGLTLAEIRDLLRLDERPGTGQCRQVHQLLQRKLADLDARLVEIREFRRTLNAYLTQCNRTLAHEPDAACPVVEDLRGSAR